MWFKSTHFDCTNAHTVTSVIKYRRQSVKQANRIRSWTIRYYNASTTVYRVSVDFYLVRGIILLAAHSNHLVFWCGAAAAVNNSSSSAHARVSEHRVVAQCTSTWFKCILIAIWLLHMRRHSANVVISLTNFRINCSCRSFGSSEWEKGETHMRAEWKFLTACCTCCEILFNVAEKLATTIRKPWIRVCVDLCLNVSGRHFVCGPAAPFYGDATAIDIRQRHTTTFVCFQTNERD